MVAKPVVKNAIFARRRRVHVFFFKVVPFGGRLGEKFGVLGVENDGFLSQKTAVKRQPAGQLAARRR